MGGMDQFFLLEGKPHSAMDHFAQRAQKTSKLTWGPKWETKI